MFALSEPRVEVILKVAERCNINCSYCYFFHSADDSYKRHAPIIASSTVHAVAHYLREGAEALDLRHIQIDFHGGEPLLMPQLQFASMCRLFRDVLGGAVDLRLCVQTNAMLVDSSWIELFSEYGVNVSTSLDGPLDYHDRYRVDFRGHGTHARTVAGIHQLREAVARGALPGFGVLCVINPEHSASRIYRYFVDELGLDSMDFLLPEMTHDSYSGPPPTAYGEFLCELFHAWAGDDEPRIQVRILNSVMSLMLGGRTRVVGFGPEMPAAITIASSGAIGPDDTFRVCGTEYIDAGMTVFNTNLSTFLESRFMREFVKAKQQLAAQCQGCCWERVCGGGQLPHRYGSRHGFDAPSIFCEGLKPFFAEVARYLLAHGVPQERLLAVLLGRDGNTEAGRAKVCAEGGARTSAQAS